jgi:plasmid stability protein
MLQVRDVPDRVHQALRERAARRGKSLSAYVLEQLEHLAREQPLDEWLEEVHRHPPVRLRASTARLVRRERERR